MLFWVVPFTSARHSWEVFADVDAFRSRLMREFEDEIPKSPPEAAEQATEALRAALMDGKRRLRIEIPEDGEDEFILSLESALKVVRGPTDMVATRQQLRDGCVVVNSRLEVDPIEFSSATMAYLLRPLLAKDTKLCVYRRYPDPFRLFVKTDDRYRRVAAFDEEPTTSEILRSIDN
ncbi:hypothetical protein CTAYLR_004186 [Chrysophaeum taylorii]|uniref:DUF1995 domain-containing protein n=1 Tax=Chrysophaeum taylorii TaxID=2483200 RepID=A0AAD7UHP9_9STRA|nr:hypothetical protein CTAYLR_004186 [Chrysophaeum taylorii]